MLERCAVIDIGTNSVKLLVAEVGSRDIRPLLEKSKQTRLGQGFYDTRRLLPEPIVQTARAVAAFAEEAAALGAPAPRVVATSAARDALNQEELAQAIRQTAGLGMEVISGEQEAEWAFRGVATDPALRGQRLMILDVGGGSTEIIVGAGDHHSFRHSFPMGSVRLLEQLRPGDPPAAGELANCRAWLDEFLRRQIAPALGPVLPAGGPGGLQLVGTGGTTTILARMEQEMSDFDRERIEGTRLSQARVRYWMERLWGLPLAERRNIIGLPPNRADVILTGVGIYEAVMRQLGLPDVYVSTRGLRFGALLDSR